MFSVTDAAYASLFAIAVVAAIAIGLGIFPS